MLPRTLFIALTVALAGTPFVTAADPCYTTPPEDETMRYPLSSGYYILLELDEAGNTDALGFWQETNNVDHLQREDCVRGAVVHYEADKKVATPLA